MKTRISNTLESHYKNRLNSCVPDNGLETCAKKQAQEGRNASPLLSDTLCLALVISHKTVAAISLYAKIWGVSE